MSKFATILLRIIMVISFVGIIVFVTFAIINNQNITFEAYNYISSSYEDFEFDSFYNKVKTNVKSEYNGSVDTYAKYINEAVLELNAGNKYFLNYLASQKDITKGEQDKLKSLFSDYKQKYSAVKDAYSSYMDAYSDADYKYNYDYSNSSVALSIVISKCVYFVEKYTDCYVSGSAFFKSLVEVYNKYSLQNTSNFTYKNQIYLIKVGLVDHSTDFVYNSMKNKKENRYYDTNARNNDLVDAFYDVKSRENNFKDENVITNTNFQVFVSNLNDLNTYDWAGDYEGYKDSLRDNASKEKCESAHSFFVSNFRG